MTPISFNLAKEDVLALACHYYATSPTIRRNRLKMQLAVGLILAGAGVLTLIGTDQTSGSGAVGIVLLVCAGVSVAFFPSWYRRGVRRAAEKMIEESSYGKAFGRYTLALSEEGIASKSPTGEGKNTWEAVNSVALTAQHLFIFLVGPQGFAIPRAQLPDSTIREVKAFAESHIRRTEPGAPPNGGPATRSANPGVSVGPPSVS